LELKEFRAIVGGLFGFVRICGSIIFRLKSEMANWGETGHFWSRHNSEDSENRHDLSSKVCPFDMFTTCVIFSFLTVGVSFRFVKMKRKRREEKR
jgi:hypothetical protein